MSCQKSRNPLKEFTAIRGLTIFKIIERVKNLCSNGLFKYFIDDIGL